MEWELSKENVQPLKSGRNVEVLNDALKAKAEGPARSNTFEHQRRQFLEAIENYVGEDPLDPWIRYIKWANDAYPAGGGQSELLKLLENCTREFQKDERYRRDVRYLRIWVQYADCCSDPSDILEFLEANDIGQDYALFYEAYATSMEVRRKFSRADEIYNLGLQRSAQPLGRLESMYKSFANRMIRRGERKFREEQQAVYKENYNENDVQSRSFGPSAAYSGDAGGFQAGRHRARPVAMPPPRQPVSRPGNSGLSVFVDPQFGGPPKASAEEGKYVPSSKENQPASWSHMGSIADKIKENVQQPTKWSKAKIGQAAHGQHGPQSELKIMVDEEFAEEQNFKPRINVTKSAKPSLRLRLEDMQKTKRQSPDLKGSFLDFPEASTASTTQGSTKHLSESSRNVSVQDAAAVKSNAKTVFGYDSSLINANGTDRSFEEFRWSLWKEKSDGDFIVDCVSREPAAAKLDPLTDFHLQPQKTIPPTLPEQPAIVHVNSFSMPGEETVAIKRFAEEVIVLGTDPKVNSIDTVSHHGLVEPTINTKEALADILDMFNKPLECDNDQLKVRISKTTKKRSSNPAAKSSGFEIFVDDDLDMPSPAQTTKDERRTKEISGRLSADPVVQTKGFHSFVDENSCVQKPPGNAMNGRPMSRPLDSISPFTGFSIYEDEDLDVQGSYNTERSVGKRAEAFSSSPLVPVSQSGGFSIFVDEDFNLSGTLDPQSLRESKATTCTALDPGFGSSAFQILPNDDLILDSRSLRESKATTSTALNSGFGSSAFQILPDDDLILDSRSLRESKATACTALNSGFGSSAFQILPDDDLIMKGPLHLAKNDDSRAFQILVDDNLVRKRPLQPTKDEDLSIGVDNELRKMSVSLEKLDADCTKNQPQDHLSPVGGKRTASNIFETDDFGVQKASEEIASTDLAGSSEMNAATRPMKVNPWGERHLQDLLMRLKPHMEQYEDFFESSEKYGGSISISSLRSSTCRNKILQLGSNTYRLKGCVGQGAFAQVFEVEDEDEDLFGNATKLALKFQKPACPWEFYVYRQLDLRIRNEDRCYYGQVQRFHLYSDCSFMISNYGEKGTLQDIVNSYLAQGQRMEETLCMFYTIEMLRMLEILHGVGIIHGDFKPDNLLIRDDSDELDAWTRDRHGDWKSQGLSLIDWGRSIDITLYPEGIQFMGDCKTDAFRCPEMLEHRPWSFQVQIATKSLRVLFILAAVDTFGLCGVVHCLLHGSYMQVEKTQTADAQIYRPTSPYRRYWNVELWRGFFETLLNENDTAHNRTLGVLRQKFEDHLTEKSLGKKVQGLLMKQRIMMHISRPGLSSTESSTAQPGAETDASDAIQS